MPPYFIAGKRTYRSHISAQKLQNPLGGAINKNVLSEQNKAEETLLRADRIAKSVRGMSPPQHLPF